jgi:CPA2 family monovalent cation:H+ antiporter-2
MDIPLLNDIVVIFALSMAVLFLCHRLHVPTIVGFLCTGVLAGPYGLGLIQGVHDIELLAEVGVVLLLFTIGIEFSLESLRHLKRVILLGGSLQVILTLALAAALSRQFGYPLGEATFIGCLLALSSTAIVLKLLQERAEIDSPHGHTALSILIFQDLVVVPMMLLTPLLSGQAGDNAPSFLLPMASGLGIIAIAPRRSRCAAALACTTHNRFVPDARGTGCRTPTPAARPSFDYWGYPFKAGQLGYDWRCSECPKFPSLQADGSVA